MNLINSSLVALAQGARLNNLTRPLLTTDNVIDIQGGRLLSSLRLPDKC